MVSMMRRKAFEFYNKKKCQHDVLNDVSPLGNVKVLNETLSIIYEWNPW